MQIKKAIILSAGYGKRLNPMTLYQPKSLLKINKKTLLENTIHILEKFGIEEIVINTHYLSDQINTFIDNKKFSSKIFLIEEHEKILFMISIFCQYKEILKLLEFFQDFSKEIKKNNI